MNNQIVITKDGSHSIFNPIINECYHSKNGAIIEAEHVFIKNGFSSFQKESINILEVGFGSGLNALLTYQKAEQKLTRVNYHAIELYPLKKKILMQLNYTNLIGLKKKEFLIISKDWPLGKVLLTTFDIISYFLDNM